jgi:hypothetical protein
MVNKLYKEGILVDDIELGKTGMVILIFTQNCIFSQAGF